MTVEDKGPKDGKENSKEDGKENGEEDNSKGTKDSHTTCYTSACCLERATPQPVTTYSTKDCPCGPARRSWR